MPRWFLSELLFFAGSGFLAENLLGSRKFLSASEWGTIICIVVAFVVTNFSMLYAVSFGMGCCCLQFVHEFASVSAVMEVTLGRPGRCR